MKAWKSNLAPMGYTGSDPTGNQLGIKKSYQFLCRHNIFRTNSFTKLQVLDINPKCFVIVGMSQLVVCVVTIPRLECEAAGQRLIET